VLAVSPRKRHEISQAIYTYERSTFLGDVRRSIP
jgi:hypothetical protein